jgi:hypothetical protein
MKTFAGLAFTISLLGIIFGIWDYAVQRTLSSIEDEAAILAGKVPQYHPLSAADEVSRLFSQLQSLGKYANTFPDVAFSLGKANLVKSLHAQSMNERVSLFCDALSSFQGATQSSPHNPRYQIAWADVQAQLPSAEVVCPGLGATLRSSGTQLSTAERLAWAEELAPFSTTDLYLSSIVYLSLGLKDKALSLLRLNQEINPSFTNEQRDYTYNLVNTQEELLLAMPPHYPEILSWIWYFSRNRESDYLLWKDSFVTSLNQAITELQTRFRQGKITPDAYSGYLKSINALPLIPASEVLRSRLDDLMANIYEVEGNTFWSGVLAKRQMLSRLRVLKALVVDDKQPGSTMLFGWVPDSEPRSAEIDVLGRSVGIYLPRGNQLQMLVLQSTTLSEGLDKKSLEVLYSNDNQSFHPLNIGDQIASGVVDGKETLVITFPQANFRYLKLRYLGSNREPRFANRFSDLIQAYGVVL